MGSTKIPWRWRLLAILFVIPMALGIGWLPLFRKTGSVVLWTARVPPPPSWSSAREPHVILWRIERTRGTIAPTAREVGIVAVVDPPGMIGMGEDEVRMSSSPESIAIVSHLRSTGGPLPDWDELEGWSGRPIDSMLWIGIIKNTVVYAVIMLGCCEFIGRLRGRRGVGWSLIVQSQLSTIPAIVATALDSMAKIMTYTGLAWPAIMLPAELLWWFGLLASLFWAVRTISKIPRAWMRVSACACHVIVLVSGIFWISTFLEYSGGVLPERQWLSIFIVILISWATICMCISIYCVEISRRIGAKRAKEIGGAQCLYCGYPRNMSSMVCSECGTCYPRQ